MKTAAIICEYNPFHNGHKFQIDTARRLTECDCIVGLMSGNYVQRGDFAVFPKEVRGQMALKCGVDLVLENPSYCVLRSAEGYAQAAIYTLESLNAIDYLVFGAECNCFEKLYDIAKFLVCETDDFKRSLASKLSSGMAFASARSLAVKEALGDEADLILKQPNNLLAVEYLKAMIKLKSKIKPVLIPRRGVGHTDVEPNGKFASGTALRKYIANNVDISELYPSSCEKLYEARPFDYAIADAAVLSTLCLCDTEHIKNTDGIAEGLENKIKREVFNSYSIDELVERVKSKRYAYTRIRRAILSSYINIEKEEASILPEYVKILSFNDIGQLFLNQAKKSASIILAKNASPLLKNKSAIAQWKKELERERAYEVLYSACKTGK